MLDDRFDGKHITVKRLFGSLTVQTVRLRSIRNDGLKGGGRHGEILRMIDLLLDRRPTPKWKQTVHAIDVARPNFRELVRGEGTQRDTTDKMLSDYLSLVKFGPNLSKIDDPTHPKE